MIWTVLILCDADEGVTYARGHFEAESPEDAAHSAYRALLGDVEPMVLEVIVYRGVQRNALRYPSVTRHELNA